MPQAIAKWRCMPGLRFTSPASVLSVDLEAFTDLRPSILGGEGGIHSVRFRVRTEAGTVVKEIAQASPSLRFPNYSAASSPLPGAPAGTMAALWAFGLTLTLSELPYGKLFVQAEVRSQKGTVTVVGDQIWLFNDLDGSDSRGSSKVIYANAQTGSDANPGTSVSPVKTLIGALKKCPRNPTGSTLSDRHCGGAEIIATGNFVGFSDAYELTQWHSADQWLTIRATPGTTFTRSSTSGRNFFSSIGVANSNVMRTRWIGWTFVGAGPECYVGEWPTTTAFCHNWLDGFTQTPVLWNESVPWDVRYADGGNEAIDYTGPGGPTGKTYYSCARFKGRGASSEFTYMHDVVVGPYIAIAFQMNVKQQGPQMCNVLIERQRYQTPDVLGLWNSRGTNLIVTVPVAGQMRVEQVGPVIMLENNSSPVNLPGNPTIELDVQLAQMPGYTAWQYRFENCANAGNNGDHEVLSVGRTGGGNPYAIFSNPSAVAETLGSSVRIRTTRPGGQNWYDAVHPDLMQMNTDTTEAVMTNIAARDIDNSQGWFGGGHTHHRCVMFNMTDGGNPTVRNNFGGCTFTDSIFAHCGFAAQFALSSASVSGSSFVENVFSDVSGAPSVVTNYWFGNHFISGAVFAS